MEIRKFVEVGDVAGYTQIVEGDAVLCGIIFVKRANAEFDVIPGTDDIPAGSEAKDVGGFHVFANSDQETMLNFEFKGGIRVKTKVANTARMLVIYNQ